MTVGSLFTGIGGLDLGLERAGMQVRWQCELNPYCQRVLRKHWPAIKLYGDIRDIDTTTERVDLVCGGFPCQPVSLAGKGLAQKDPRWLWPEFARVIGLLRPRYVIVENVPGLRKRGLEDVIGDLASMGYDAEWQIVSAASVGAPHLRERFVIVAYASGEFVWNESGWRSGQSGEGSSVSGVDGATRPVADSESLGWNRSGTALEEQISGARQSARTAGPPGNVQDANGSPLESWRLGWGTPQTGSTEWWATEPDVGRVAHGVPSRLDRLTCLGNAVVPQVAEFVGRLIMAAA